MEFHHKPVLFEETIQSLAIRPEGLYIDGTMGGGGHSEAIVKQLTTGRLLSIDQDPDAMRAAGERLGKYPQSVRVRGNFAQMGELARAQGMDAVDGVLLDIGVSSYQLDTPERGFSYHHDAPLDMRMDRSAGLTAFEVVNTWPREELRRILYAYGEERYAPQIAAAIDRRRAAAPISTTLELVDVIRSAMPPQALREKQHPAKRSFQAIRIAVNDELAAVDRMLQAAVPRLSPGGRLAVISFHSLEDRIVKNALAAFARGCTCPPDFPVCVCGRTPQARLITRKPILPSEEELAENNRSHSAKLRVCERI